MTKHIIEFFITYFVIPYSVILYIALTSFVLRDFFVSWRKERKEKQAEKKSKSSGPTTKG